jgi:chromosome partitioning protein
MSEEKLQQYDEDTIVEVEEGPADEYSGTGRVQIQELIRRAKDVQSRLRTSVFAPDEAKRLEIRFTITEAAKLVGRSKEAIRKAEREGRLVQPEVNALNRRTGYTVNDLQEMRTVFGTLPYRSEEDEPLILAIQSFKGGVGKTTGTCHLSNYLAIKGYRILVIDTDPQASTTTTFGLYPDMLSRNETLSTFFEYDTNEIENAIQKTYWPNIDIIPSNLNLYSSEYVLSAQMGNVNVGKGALVRLKGGIDKVKHNYDIVLIDAPPALGMISLNVLSATNALVVPTPPGMYDFDSTVTFLTMMDDVLLTLEELLGRQIDYKFVKTVITKVNESKSAHVSVAAMIKHIFENYCFETLVKDSAEVDNASTRLKTIYELDKPITSSKVHNRAKNYFDAFNGEVELLIRKTWPSHKQALRDKGLL